MSTGGGDGQAGPVAAFDFDGTLTRRDTLMPFLARVRGPAAFARALAGAVRPGLDRDGRKAAVLRRLLTGVPAADFRSRAERYGETLPRLLRPELTERVAWHRRQGHRTVIVSASLRAYLGACAARLGVDDVLAVELAVDGDRLTGELAGPNVRGPEKVRRLLAWAGGRPAELWAYGNSSGDAALLDLADHPTWVGGRRRRQSATSTGGR